MRLFELICVCILILYISGGTNRLHEDDGNGTLIPAYTAVFVLSLGRFTVTPYPELSINAAVVLTPLLLLLFAVRAGERMGWAALLLLLTLSAAIGVGNAMLAWNDGMLIGLLCAIPALFIIKIPATAYFTASVMPVFAALFSSYTELVRSAYTCCDLGGGYTLDAMMTALALTAIVSAMRRAGAVRSGADAG